MFERGAIASVGEFLVGVLLLFEHIEDEGVVGVQGGQGFVFILFVVPFDFLFGFEEEIVENDVVGASLFVLGCILHYYRVYHT